MRSLILRAAVRGLAVCALVCGAAGAYDQSNPYSLGNGLSQARRYSQQNQRADQQQEKQAQQQQEKAKKLLEEAKQMAEKAKAEADKLKAKDKDKSKDKEKAKPKKKKKEAADGEDAPKSETAKIDEEELDNIELDTSYVIPCKIHKELPDAIVVTVNNDQGRITIPREKIRSMNYSMGTRLAALAPDDYVGQYKVGVWGMEKGMYPKAIDLFEKLREKEEVTSATDILKQLGRAYEQRGQMDKALDAYKAYAMGHTDDKDIAATVKALDEQVNPAPKETEKPAGEKIKKVADGLEGDGHWAVQQWADANPGALQNFVDPKTGNKMIYVETPGGLKDKLAFTRNGQALNLTESKEMILKIFNAGDSPVNLAVAFINAQNDFQESQQVRIAPKTWLDQSFKVDSKKYKSNRNQFKEYNQELVGLDNITAITFLVYGQRPTKLYVDSLFFK